MVLHHTTDDSAPRRTAHDSALHMVIFNTAKEEVLERWKLDFEHFFISYDADPHLMDTSDLNRKEIDTQSFNCVITFANR